MKKGPVRVLLADDDRDDCLLFEEALGELAVSTSLSVVNDGEQLLNTLLRKEPLPEVLFLDLNMPRKNGFECLSEIMANDRINRLPVIIFSTSFDPDVARLLHSKGARYYIRKPEEFENLKKVVNKGLDQVFQQAETISFSNFVLQP